MRKHHPKNVRIIRQYLTYLEDAKRMNTRSVDQVAAALAEFQVSTGYKDFALFHTEQARKFKRDLSDALNPATGKPLAKATIYSRLMALKTFFRWLAGQPGYKSKLTYSDADYFNPSNHDTHIAKAVSEKRISTLDQIRHVLSVMRATTDMEMRDRAVVAFALLTGARDNAIASIRIGHVDLKRRRVFQDARHVRTKFRKTFHSNFFPVGGEAESIVAAYIEHLTTNLLFGPSDPLFPRTRVEQDENRQFRPAGLARSGWSNAGPIRNIFKDAFEAAGLPYFNRHSVRDCLVNLANEVCTSPAEFKAWSQNLGHDHVATTWRNYGAVTPEQQSALIDGVAGRLSQGDAPKREFTKEEASQLVAQLMESLGKGAGAGSADTSTMAGHVKRQG
ncbi:MAG: tyrosine-type recombinase/integrase [Asticcacaulis sp.]